MPLRPESTATVYMFADMCLVFYIQVLFCEHHAGPERMDRAFCTVLQKRWDVPYTLHMPFQCTSILGGVHVGPVREPSALHWLVHGWGTEWIQSYAGFMAYILPVITSLPKALVFIGFAHWLQNIRATA